MRCDSGRVRSLDTARLLWAGFFLRRKKGERIQAFWKKIMAFDRIQRVGGYLPLPGEGGGALAVPTQPPTSPPPSRKGGSPKKPLGRAVHNLQRKGRRWLLVCSHTTDHNLARRKILLAQPTPPTGAPSACGKLLIDGQSLHFPPIYHVSPPCHRARSFAPGRFSDICSRPFGFPLSLKPVPPIIPWSVFAFPSAFPLPFTLPFPLPSPLPTPPLPLHFVFATLCPVFFLPMGARNAPMVPPRGGRG